MLRAEAVALAVEAAVDHLLRQDVIDDRRQQLGRHAEVAGIVQSHAADAHIALRNAAGRIDAAVRPFVMGQNVGDAFPDLRVIGRNAEMAQIQQRVVGRRPLGLVEAAAPVAGRLARGQEPRAPALRGDARSQVRPLLAEQVALHLVLDRNVAVQQPGDQGFLGKHLRHDNLRSGCTLTLAPQFYHPGHLAEMTVQVVGELPGQHVAAVDTDRRAGVLVHISAPGGAA